MKRQRVAPNKIGISGPITEGLPRVNRAVERVGQEQGIRREGRRLIRGTEGAEVLEKIAGRHTRRDGVTVHDQAVAQDRVGADG